MTGSTSFSRLRFITVTNARMKYLMVKLFTVIMLNFYQATLKDNFLL